MRTFLVSFILVLGGVVHGQQGFSDRLPGHLVHFKSLEDSVEVEQWLGVMLDSCVYHGRQDLAPDVWRKAGNWHKNYGRVRSALVYFNASEQAAVKLGDALGQAKAIGGKGTAYRLLSQYFESDSCLRRAVAMKRPFGDSISLALSHVSLAITQELVGQYADARANLDTALVLYRELDHKRGTMNAFNSLGMLAYSAVDDSTALLFFNRGLALAKDLELPKNEGVFYNNIMNVYKRQGLLDSALAMGRASIALKSRAGDRLGLATSWQNVATIHTELGQLDSAEHWLSKAYDYYHATQDGEGTASALSHMQDLALARGNNQRAVTLGQQALATAEELGLVAWQRDAHNGLSIAYEKLGNYRLAQFHLQQWVSFDNARKQSEDAQALTRLQLNHDFAIERQAERSAAQAERDRLQQALQVQTYQRKVLLWGVIAAVVVALLLLLLVRQRTRSQRQLQASNLKIARSLEDKELLLKEVHHRVKNNLQLVSSLLSLQARNLEGTAAKEAVKQSQQRIKSLAIIHQELYTREEVTGIDMHVFLQKLATGLESSFSGAEREISVEVDCPAHVLDVDVAIPLGLVYNELITNAFKHAFAGRDSGKIQVGFAMEQDGWHGYVADNGVGLASKEALDADASFGSRMVEVLCQRLGGELRAHMENGLTYRMSGPKMA